MVIVSKFKGLQRESIKPPATWDNSLNPRLRYNDHPKIPVKFNGNCLKQEKVTFTPNTILIFALFIK